MITAQSVAEKLEEISRLSCHAATRPHGYTYVIGSGAGGLIKIGKTTAPVARLVDIQHMGPTPLVVLSIVHGEHMEAILHGQLDDSRRHGEWFMASNPIEHSDPCLGCITDHECERHVRRPITVFGPYPHRGRWRLTIRTTSGGAQANNWRSFDTEHECAYRVEQARSVLRDYGTSTTLTNRDVASVLARLLR